MVYNGIAFEKYEIKIINKMKTHKILNKRLLLLLAAFISVAVSYGQDAKQDEQTQKKTAIENSVRSKNYVFVAQTVLPLAGRAINLTTPYNLKVAGDTLVSDLPYFGRSYVAPVNPADGGIRFTSTDVSYKAKDRKKGGWEIVLVPKDTKDVRQMFLTISENGYASLQVLSNNRQSIGFNGYISGFGNYNTGKNTR